MLGLIQRFEKAEVATRILRKFLAENHSEVLHTVDKDKGLDRLAALVDQLVDEHLLGGKWTVTRAAMSQGP